MKAISVGAPCGAFIGMIENHLQKVSQIHFLPLEKWLEVDILKFYCPCWIVPPKQEVVQKGHQAYDNKYGTEAPLAKLHQGKLGDYKKVVGVELVIVESDITIRINDSI